MPSLAEFLPFEQQLAELERVKEYSALRKEIEFEQKLRTLLIQYYFGLKDMITLLDPKADHRAPESVSQKRTRKSRGIPGSILPTYC